MALARVRVPRRRVGVLVRPRPPPVRPPVVPRPRPPVRPPVVPPIVPPVVPPVRPPPIEKDLTPKPVERIIGEDARKPPPPTESPTPVSGWTRLPNNYVLKKGETYAGVVRSRIPIAVPLVTRIHQILMRVRGLRILRTERPDPNTAYIYFTVASPPVTVGKLIAMIAVLILGTFAIYRVTDPETVSKGVETFMPVAVPLLAVAGIFLLYELLKK